MFEWRNFNQLVEASRIIAHRSMPKGWLSRQGIVPVRKHIATEIFPEDHTLLRVEAYSRLGSKRSYSTDLAVQTIGGEGDRKDLTLLYSYAGTIGVKSTHCADMHNVHDLAQLSGIEKDRVFEHLAAPLQASLKSI